MYSSRIIFVLFIVFGSIAGAFSASNRDTVDLIAISEADIDTDTTSSKHSPPLATVLSAIVPGAGQVYNRKYWKVPLIYAGFAGIGYTAYYNGERYNKYKKVIIHYNNLDSAQQKGTVIVGGRSVSVDNVKAVRDDFRRYRDLNLIIMGGWYVLNIIDANVDAHFFDYDISEDLSLRWQPDFILGARQTAYVGASFSIRF